MNTVDLYLQRARALHERALVVDTHCDTTQRLKDPAWNFGLRDPRGHVDLPRLREGGVGAMFLAVWVPPARQGADAVAAARRQIRRIHETAARYPDVVALARSAPEVRRAKAGGRIALLVAIEGGHLIDDSLEVLREFRRDGATYLTLTHALHTHWGDSSGVHEALAPLHGGLTAFGREVVRELNRLGMMVDVSHVSDATFFDVVETSRAPIVATHSSCRAVSPHRRNLTDEMMRAIAASGGVVQINFAAAFVDPGFPRLDPEVVEAYFAAGDFSRPVTDHRTPLELLVDHFDHALRTIGADHVGIGSDFDGVPALPAGLEDCSKLPYLTAALLRRGYAEEELVKVLGGNVLRVMEACARVADAA